jgi:hypothetical protein
MAWMNWSAYQPFGKMMLVLEEKGFTRKADRPTVRRVRPPHLSPHISTPFPKTTLLLPRTSRVVLLSLHPC